MSSREQLCLLFKTQLRREDNVCLLQIASYVQLWFCSDGQSGTRKEKCLLIYRFKAKFLIIFKFSFQQHFVHTSSLP